jgi:NADPH:quinone reductase-like Zn-dependent oxidoreductase
MSTNVSSPVLVLGGSGVVGSRAVRALRRLQPALPITISGRDLGKADTLARRSGVPHATER